MIEEQLSDVILSSDPRARLEDGWSGVTQRVCDVDQLAAGPNSWQVKVNRSRVGPGTVGWIHRWSEGGRLAALIRFTSAPYPREEPNGVIHYCDGLLHHLVDPVPGHRIGVLAGLLGAEDRAWLEHVRQL